MIVPVDKAANNYAIVCKSFYIQVLMKELGVVSENDISGNAVYQHVNISQEDFFKSQEVANRQLGNCLEEENRYIPLLYWTSKQHKNPYKFRFIAGASRCTNKTISKEVALALKHIKTQFKNYCNVINLNQPERGPHGPRTCSRYYRNCRNRYFFPVKFEFVRNFVTFLLKKRQFDTLSGFRIRN